MKNSREKSENYSIIMMGATGAVGSEALKQLLKMPQINRISLLGRRAVTGLSTAIVEQHQINIFDPTTYFNLISNHNVAICTLGVGQPSKMSKENFVKIDKQAVLNFAKVCKASDVKHFELLSSVGVSSKSSSFFLRTKGELIDELIALNFESLSIFQPSMILTPTNRYGVSQAIILAVWPWISLLLFGSLRQYRGIRVEKLGQSMALNILNKTSGIEYLKWDNFESLVNSNN